MGSSQSRIQLQCFTSSSSPFSLTACLLLLWLFFSSPTAEANQSEKGTASPENVGSDVAKLRDQADGGDAIAEYRLGSLYMTGMVVTSDYKEAARYMHLAAEQGLPEAETVMGYLYENGKGVPRDYRKAFDYYAAAAKRGDLTAANNLGVMYRHGHGVRRDSRQAVDWYRRAAEGGNVVGQCDLGIMYYLGRGVTQDYVLAAEWFRKAAENGHAPGQLILCVDVLHGEGCTAGLRNGSTLAAIGRAEWRTIWTNELGISLRTRKGRAA